MECNIDKISKTAAKVVLLVAFSVNSFDYSSINRNLNPLEKHLKVKTCMLNSKVCCSKGPCTRVKLQLS